MTASMYEEAPAMESMGIGSDELNQLLLRGAR